VRSEEGHRREYTAVLCEVIRSLGGEPVVGPMRLKNAFDSAPLLVPMLEEYTLLFAICAALRSLFGRRSVTLLFRPGPCIRPTTWRLVFKAAILRGLRHLKGVHILTILPFAVDPDFRKVATGWIYELQLWDMLGRTPPPRTKMPEQVHGIAAGRRVLMALGGQNAEKGFDQLARIWIAHPALRERWLFAAVGPVSEASREIAEAFMKEGGVVIDSYVDDEDLWSLYGAADLIWTCYAPSYNQSSGVFGRAFQAGIPTVIRQGAYLATLAELLDHPVLSLPWDDRDAAARLLNSEAAVRLSARPLGESIKSHASTRTEKLRAESIAHITAALGEN
jgi:hypothetical protein